MFNGLAAETFPLAFKHGYCRSRENILKHFGAVTKRERPGGQTPSKKVMVIHLPVTYSLVVIPAPRQFVILFRC